MLSERPDIAQGFPKSSKEDVQSFWEEVALQLNSLAPPLKDVTTWKKVWLDYKSYVKRKLAINKIESRATGGGSNKMHSFNSIEETVIRLAGLETSTAGIRNSRPCGLERPRCENEEISASASPATASNDMHDCSMQSEPEPSSINVVPGRRDENSPRALLQKQIAMQQEFYNNNEEFSKRTLQTMDEISTSLRRLNRANESLAKSQTDILHEMRRHNLAMEQLKREEIDRMFNLPPNNNN